MEVTRKLGTVVSHRREIRRRYTRSPTIDCSSDLSLSLIASYRALHKIYFHTLLNFANVSYPIHSIAACLVRQTLFVARGRIFVKNDSKRTVHVLKNLKGLIFFASTVSKLTIRTKRLKKNRMDEITSRGFTLDRTRPNTNCTRLYDCISLLLIAPNLIIES